MTGTVYAGGLGAIFGAGEPNATTLNVPMASLFVARYRADGSLAFARASAQAVVITSGTWSGSASGTAIAALPGGGSLVTGAFQTVCSLWPGELVAAGGSDILTMRVAEDGSVAWARAAGGAGDDLTTSTALAPDGSALVAGSFRASAVFGRGEPGETTLAAGPAGYDLFLMRMATR